MNKNLIYLFLTSLLLVFCHASEIITVDFNLDTSKLTDLITKANNKRKVALDLIKVKNSDKPLQCIDDIITEVHKKPSKPIEEEQPNHIVDQIATYKTSTLEKVKELVSEFIAHSRALDNHSYFALAAHLSHGYEQSDTSSKTVEEKNTIKKVIGEIKQFSDDLKTRLHGFKLEEATSFKDKPSPFDDNLKPKTESEGYDGVSFYRNFYISNTEMDRLVNGIDQLIAINNKKIEELQLKVQSDEDKQKSKFEPALLSKQKVAEELTHIANSFQSIKVNLSLREELVSAYYEKESTLLDEVTKPETEDIVQPKTEVSEYVYNLKNRSSMVRHKLKSSFGVEKDVKQIQEEVGSRMSDAIEYFTKEVEKSANNENFTWSGAHSWISELAMKCPNTKAEYTNEEVFVKVPEFVITFDDKLPGTKGKSIADGKMCKVHVTYVFSHPVHSHINSVTFDESIDKDSELTHTMSFPFAAEDIAFSSPQVKAVVKLENEMPEKFMQQASNKSEYEVSGCTIALIGKNKVNLIINIKEKAVLLI